MLSRLYMQYLFYDEGNDMDAAFNSVLTIITSTWTWLGSWSYHGVSFGAYILGFIILSILINRIFGA